MNYRHAFHAGNFADVVKHVALTRILTYLHDKPAPFRVIDTHAGAGLYDLTSDEAVRGGEWPDGIGRVDAAELSAEAEALLAPYRAAVRACNPQGELVAYPGSPLIARALLRPQDHLLACETAPAAHAALLEALRGDLQARVHARDGWEALMAFLPPKERRGLVIIDPPFEARDEFIRLGQALTQAYRKWPTGIYLVWYPVKDRRAANGLLATAAALTDKNLCIEVTVGSPDPGGLRCAGVLVLNPPWVLEREMAVILPALTRFLGATPPGQFRLSAIKS